MLSHCLRTSCLVVYFLPNNQNKGQSVWVFLKLLHSMSSSLEHVVTSCYMCFPGSGKSEGSPVALQETSKPSQEEGREVNKPSRPTVSCIPTALTYYLAILHFLFQYAHYSLDFLLCLVSFLSSIFLKVHLVLCECRCDLQMWL